MSSQPSTVRFRHAPLLGVLASVALFFVLVVGLCGCEGTPSKRAAAPEENAVERLEGGRFRARRTLMGTFFVIQVSQVDEATAHRAMNAALDEVERVEALISEWRESSEISEVIRAAGGDPVVVGPELLDVLIAAQQASRQTRGAFDVSFAACGSLWDFERRTIPATDALAQCLERVDYRQIELDVNRSTVRLRQKGMRIGTGGVGKGYGVDRAAELLEAEGIKNYIVDGGGDIRLRGQRAAGEPWRTGIAAPRARGELYATMVVGEGAVVSSGDYERFFEVDGVRYHHILNPQTGSPAGASMAVTVIAPTATQADALSTGFFVLGAQRALELVNTMPNVEALIFDKDGVVHTSQNFPVLDLVAGGTRAP